MAFTLISVAILWFVAERYGILVAVIVASVYFVASPTLWFGIYVLYNESITLFMAVTFFLAASPAFSPEVRRPWFASAAFGVAGGLLYMLKMNYVVWALAAIPGYGVAVLVGRFSWRTGLARSAIFAGSLATTIVVLGVLLLGRSGFRQMIDAHTALVLGAGYYGSGSRTVLSLSALLSGLESLWHGERYMMYTIAVLLAVAVVLALVKVRDGVWFRDHLPEGIFLFAGLFGMILAILKHYVPYYLVSVSAVLPFIVLWQVRAGRAWTALLLIPFVYMGVQATALAQWHHRQSAVVYARETIEDTEAIMQLRVADGQVRLWMYRIIAPEFQRNFLVDFSSLPMLQKHVVALQGREYNFSPWNDWVLYEGRLTKMEHVPWQYLVVDRNHMKYVSESLHPWAKDESMKRTEFNRLILIERPISTETLGQ